ncbi:Sister chromatid cohesion protein 2 [Lobosporangium transversale]|nr:Sister chromatid cohesion protein 2 [Lobosporangium transversale]
MHQRQSPTKSVQLHEQNPLNDAVPCHSLPMNAQTGLQYSPLASITSADSVLRGLPSISIDFPAFRLLKPQGPEAQYLFSPHEHTRSVPSTQLEYLKAIITNADLTDIRFPPVAQIIGNTESFSHHIDQPLSSLAESIMYHCSKNRHEDFNTGDIYQLPVIEPFSALREFQQSTSTSSDFITAIDHLEEIPESEVEDNSSSSTLRASKRPPQQSWDDNGPQSTGRRLKKPKHQSSLSTVDVSATPQPDKTPCNEISSRIQCTSYLSAEVTQSTPTALMMQSLLTNDNDPTPAFEDFVLNFLDSEDKMDELNLKSMDFSLSAAQNITQIEEFLKQGLLESLPADILCRLLKHMDTRLNGFASEGILSKGNDDLIDDNPSGAHVLLDRITLYLDYVVLSFTLFAKLGLHQQFFPEELLMSSLLVFKLSLDRFLKPVLEFSKETCPTSEELLMAEMLSENDTIKPRVISLVSKVSRASNALLSTCRQELSDDFVLKVIYAAISLFFIDPSSERALSGTETESLKQAGSSLLRTIYEKYTKYRTWILEEILSLLIKLPHGKKMSKGYKLKDGSKIHSSSALLMQLIQTCSSCPSSALLPQDFHDLDISMQSLAMQKLLNEIKVVSETEKSNAAYIFNFLLLRCIKGFKMTSEIEYKIVLDSLIADLLVVLGQPEWPSAETCLLLFSTAMTRYLDDVKADVTIKVMAIEALGSIATQIKTIMYNSKKEQSRDCPSSCGGDENSPFYGIVCAQIEPRDLMYLKARYKNVVDYLGSNETNDPGAKAAKDFWICEWIGLMCTAVTKNPTAHVWADDSWKMILEEIWSYWRLYAGHNQKPIPRRLTIWKEALQSAMYLTSRQQLFLSFDLLLSRILPALEGGTVTLRTKSLKALSSIVTGDYSVLAQQNVRKTIALRLQDTSPLVRDAAVDLVGKYMMQDVTIRKAYYDIVSDRISDTGLNVRKRVLRLLRDIYHRTESHELRSDISQKLLLRVNDDDISVKELAIKSVSDVWFGPIVDAAQSVEGGYEEQSRVSSTSASITFSQRREVSKYARTLVDMVGTLSMQQDEALGSVLRHMLKRDQSLDQSHSIKDFTKSCAVVVNCLVDLVQTLQDEDAPKSIVASTVQTLHLFLRSKPHLAEVKHLSALLTYLHCCVDSDDWRITMFVLRIYQDTIPVMPDMPTNDSQMAERLALALVAKCPLVLLPDAATVLCNIVKVWTRNYSRLCKFFQACMDVLIADIKKLETGVALQESKTRRLMTIVSLVCRHFPFEKIIKGCPSEDRLSDLKSKMYPTVQGFVFNTLATLYELMDDNSLRLNALQGLGHLYMAFPILMNMQRSLAIMDTIFSDRNNELKIEMLRTYTDFLVNTQATSSSRSEKEAYTLITNAEDNLEAGIGSAVMQRYLDRILQCALVNDLQLQVAAVDVISQVTQQALVHPMLCMPAVVALESSEDLILAGRAFKIHRELHQKHASLIYARIMECVRTMFAFRKNLQQEALSIQGYKINPETGDAIALVYPMYVLAGEKRQVRNSFLSSLVKALDVDLTGMQFEVDGIYSRFIAENLAYLEFKTTEEVYLVIFYLNRIIAGTGMTLLQNLIRVTQPASNAHRDPAIKKKGGGGKARIRTRESGLSSSTPKSKLHNMKVQSSSAIGGEHSEDIADGTYSGEDEPYLERDKGNRELYMPIRMIAKASIPVEAAIVLKSYLKRMYEISEVKSQQFLPTSHGSHKEKPLPRMTGAQARIRWRSGSDELIAICAQDDVQDDISQALSKRQLDRFRELIEAETVQPSLIDDSQNH